MARCEQCTKRAKFVCASCGADICYDHCRWRERSGRNYPVCTYCEAFQPAHAPLSGHARHLSHATHHKGAAELARLYANTATEAEREAFVAVMVAEWAGEGTVVSPERARAELDTLLLRHPDAL